MAVTRAKRSRSGPDEAPKRPAASAAKKARKTNDDGDGDAEKKKPVHVPAAAVVKALLSDKAYALAYPPIDEGHGEIDWDAKDRRKPLPNANAGKKAAAKQQQHRDGGGSVPADVSTGKPRGYSSADLSPYEELLCAVMLSKPLSHKLGIRAIATLLSPPYALTTVEALARAGDEGRRAPLYAAKTQHKDKTATQLGAFAEALQSVCGADKDDRNALRAVQQAVAQSKTQKEAVQAVHHHLVDNVKGLGPTGAAIFLRRIQSHKGWHNVYPYIDERTADTARRLGVLRDAAADTTNAAQQLADMIDGSTADERRRKFVRLLDVLVGLGFRKDIDAVKREILS